MLLLGGLQNLRPPKYLLRHLFPPPGWVFKYTIFLSHRVPINGGQIYITYDIYIQCVRVPLAVLVWVCAWHYRFPIKKTIWETKNQETWVIAMWGHGIVALSGTQTQKWNPVFPMTGEIQCYRAFPPFMTPLSTMSRLTMQSCCVCCVAIALLCMRYAVVLSCCNGYCVHVFMWMWRIVKLQ